MMLQAALVLCLVSVVLGDGCCTPRKWEGREYIAGGFTKRFGRSGEIMNAYSISYDADSRRIAVAGKYREKDTLRSFKFIADYNATKGYFILPDNGRCKSFVLRKPFREACIPDKAKEMGSSFLGAGSQVLDVKAYRMSYMDRKAKLQAVAVVTSDNCVPVSEDVWGKYKRVRFFENVNFGGITPGIKDPTVFNPPDFCKKNDPEIMETLEEEFHDQYTMLQI